MRQPDALFHVAVEADALGHAERRRLAHIVQQRAQRQRRRGMVAASRAAAACAPRRRLRDDIPAAAPRPSWPPLPAGCRPAGRSHPAVRSRAARRLRSGCAPARRAPARPKPAGSARDARRMAVERGRLDRRNPAARRSAPRAAAAGGLRGTARRGRRWRGPRGAPDRRGPPTKSSTSPVSGSIIRPLMVKSRRSTSCARIALEVHAARDGGRRCSRGRCGRWPLPPGRRRRAPAPRRSARPPGRSCGNSSMMRSGRASVATSKSFGLRARAAGRARSRPPGTPGGPRRAALAITVRASASESTLPMLIWSRRTPPGGGGTSCRGAVRKDGVLSSSSPSANLAGAFESHRVVVIQENFP